MPYVTIDTRLVRMLRETERMCKRPELAGGLALWQWNLIGRWHLGDEEAETRSNPYVLRRDGYARPNGDRWLPVLAGINRQTFPEKPTTYRADIPEGIVELLAVDDRRGALAMFERSLTQPCAVWLPAPAEASLPKPDGRKTRWSRRSAL